MAPLLAQQETRAHVYACTHISKGVLMGACVGESGSPIQHIAAFDEHTHYAKACSMPGLPCAFRKG